VRSYIRDEIKRPKQVPTRSFVKNGNFTNGLLGINYVNVLCYKSLNGNQFCV